jgi:hypothetical protein
LRKPDIIVKPPSQRHGVHKVHSDVLLILFFIMLVSCATAPRASIPAEGEGRELYFLPGGGKVYFWADTVKGRPLLDVLSFEGMSGKDAGRVLDSTDRAAGVLFEEGEGRRFFLAATGNYPSVRAGLSLSFSKGWKKLKSVTGKRYWFSGGDKIALALGSDLVYVSDADPWDISSANLSGDEIPPAFMGFLPGLVLAGWMPDPSESINRIIGSLGIPIELPAEDLFFGAALKPQPVAGASADDNEIWELVFKIKVSSASHARSLLSLISLARMFMQRGAVQQTRTGAISPQEAAGLLLANAPAQDNEYLSFRTAPLSGSRIALLFEMFSVYSN